MTNAPQQSDATYTALIKAVDGSTPPPSGWNALPGGSVNDAATGLVGRAFYEQGTGRVVIAYDGVGTVSAALGRPETPVNAGAAKSDDLLRRGIEPRDLNDAIDKFVRDVGDAAKAANLSFDRTNVEATGFSIGGYAAQYTAKENGYGGTSYGGPGIPEYDGSRNANSSFVSRSFASDVIGMFGSDTGLKFSGDGGIFGTPGSHYGTFLMEGSEDQRNQLQIRLDIQSNQFFDSLSPWERALMGPDAALAQVGASNGALAGILLDTKAVHSTYIAFYANSTQQGSVQGGENPGGEIGNTPSPPNNGGATTPPTEGGATENPPPRAPSSSFIDFNDSSTIATLKAGGTISDIVAIANRNGNPITINDVALVNGLTTNMFTKLQVGQQIIVPVRSGDVITAVVANGKIEIDTSRGLTTFDYGDGAKAYYGTDNSLRAAISYDALSGDYNIATASSGNGTGTFSLSGSVGVPGYTNDGKLSVPLPNGSAVIDPQSGTASATIGGSHYEAVGSGSLSADSSGNTTIGFGSAGSAIVDSDGNGLFSLGNSVLTLPPGTRVVPSGDGGFSVVPPAGAAAAISGQGGTVVTLEPGQALNVTRDGDGAISAALAGTDNVVNIGAAGELSMAVGGVTMLDAPAGTAGAADVEALIAAAGIDLDAEQKQALEAAAAEASQTPDYPTVDTSSYAAWTQSRAAEIGAYKNDPAALALVSDPDALALYGSAMAVGAVRAALVNPTTSNVLMAVNATVKASVDMGIALDKNFLQSAARQLGIQDDPGATEYGPENLPDGVKDLRTAGEKLADYISTSGAALSTLAAVAGAIDDPSIRSVAGAVHSAIGLGMQLDETFQQSVAIALGQTKVVDGSVVADLDAMSGLMAGAGAALSVVAAIDNPTPANVAGAAMHVYNAVQGGLPVPAINAIASAIGFVENPTVEGGINTVVWAAACIPGPQQPFFVAAAAVYSVVSSIFGGGKPIVLDMDGDGVKLAPVNSSAAFYDLDGDGWREHVGWAGPGDALFAYDANGDGVISGKAELSYVGYREGARTDLEGLLAFDSNHDGKLDAKDADWSKFKVWMDDGDGLSEAGELLTPEQAGVASLTLSSDQVQVAAGGNTVYGTGTFTRADGSIAHFTDTAFGADGKGNVPLAADGTAIVFNLLGASVHTTGLQATSVSFDRDGDGTAEAGGWIAPDEGFLVADLNNDGQLEMISSFAQLAPLDSNGDGRITSADAAWTQLGIWVDKNMDGGVQRNELYTLAQLGLSGIDTGATGTSRYDNGNFIRAEGGFTFADGSHGHAAQVELSGGTQPDGNLLYVSDGITTLRQQDGRITQFVEGGTRLDVGGDIAVATGGGNVLVGGRDAVIMVSAGGDTLLGSAGNDLLITRGGTNILAGGGGADRLQGGDGDDTYVFNKGDGADTITDGGGLDTLSFGSGITAADIVVEAVGDDLVVGVRARAADQGKPASALADRVVIKGGATSVETIKFADGTSWSLGMKVVQTTNGPRLVYDDAARNDVAFWREALNAGGPGALAAEMAAALAALAAGAAVMRPDLADAAELVRQTATSHGGQSALGVVSDAAAGLTLSSVVLADLAVPNNVATPAAERQVTAAEVVSAAPQEIAPSAPVVETATVQTVTPVAPPTVAPVVPPPVVREVEAGAVVSDPKPVHGITIGPVEVPLPNRPPLAYGEVLGTDEDTPVRISAAALLANDQDPEGRHLDLVAVGDGQGGTVLLEADGTVLFRPNANFNGTASFRYFIRDDFGDIASAVARVEVAAVNDAPLLTGEAVIGTEDTVLRIAPTLLLANDSDIEGDALSITAVGNANGGTVALDGSGTVVFTPHANFNGIASFQYTVSDGQGGQSVATATVNVAAVNDAPLVTGEAIAGTEDTVLSIAPALLLANDSDIEGDSLSITAVGGASGGTVALDGAGNVVFTPMANFNGPASFQYTVSDGQGSLSVATAVVNVAAVNDAPLLTGEAIAGTEDTVLSIAPGLLLANDSDIEGDSLSITAVGNASGGTVALDGTGNVVFTPTANFNGAASFQYTVSDGQGGQSVATAAVNVTAVNDAPLVTGEMLAGIEDVVSTITCASLLANDSDIEGDSLSITSVGNASGGTVALDGLGNVVFTPTANYHGVVGFDYTVSDGHGGHSVSSAVLGLVSVNDAPVAVADALTMNEDTTLSIAVSTLLGNDTDVDGDTLTLTGVSGASNGSVSLSGDTINYTPDANFYGAASFQYTLSDGQATVTGTANITVNDVAEPSSGGGGGGGGGGGKPVVLDLDGDGIELTSINEKSVLFDINDDGFLDKLGWVAGDDGLLAYDHDGNGLIEHGNEISFAQYLDGARTDLEGLRAFDSNGDGLLDAADDQWSKFGIWRDADGDGITDAGEFRDLATAGIKDVGLDSDWNSYRDHGNTVFGHTSYSTIDGGTAIAADVMLAMEDGKAIRVELPTADPSAADMAGQIASLKSLMAAYTGTEPSAPEVPSDDTVLAVIALPEDDGQAHHV